MLQLQIPAGLIQKNTGNFSTAGKVNSKDADFKRNQ